MLTASPEPPEDGDGDDVCADRYEGGLGFGPAVDGLLDNVYGITTRARTYGVRTCF